MCKGNNWFSFITLGKIYYESSRRLSVSETSLPCGLFVLINLVIAYFVQASDDRLLKMRLDHHNQRLLRLINQLFPIIGTSLALAATKSSKELFNKKHVLHAVLLIETQIKDQSKQ